MINSGNKNFFMADTYLDFFRLTQATAIHSSQNGLRQIGRQLSGAVVSCQGAVGTLLCKKSELSFYANAVIGHRSDVSRRVDLLYRKTDYDSGIGTDKIFWTSKAV